MDRYVDNINFSSPRNALKLVYSHSLTPPAKNTAGAHARSYVIA